MKRYFSSLLIVTAILTQSPARGQGGSAGPEAIYLAVLKAPCVAEEVVRLSAEQDGPAPRNLLQDPRTQEFRRQLLADQDRVVREVRGRLSSPRDGTGVSGLDILDRQVELLNVVTVRVRGAALEALRTHPAVAGVFPNAVRYPVMDAAPALVSAPALWDQVGGVERAGEGVRIAVIDSGINVDHPMLRDDTLTAPAGFPQPSQFQAFTNSKVIVARDYVLTRFGLRAESDPNPRDLAGHGSRVAAAAAGNRVQGPVGIVQGIAPKAFLGNYRVFGSPEVNPTTTSAAIIAALRDALLDGMDIVNLSLGGPAVDPMSDPEQMAIANAVNLGIVVVAAAGNDGARGPGSVTSPGTSPATITVGATTHSRRLVNALQLQSQDTPIPPQLETIEFLPGTGVPLSESLGPLPLVSITDQDSSQEACNPNPLRAGSLQGRAALVRRGGCLFADKAANVLGVADAAALILYNNVEGPPVRADFGEPVPTRPAGMITREQGEQILELLTDGESVLVTFEPLLAVPRVADIVAGFSGRGPNIDGSIKPDLVAPGVDILSAGPREDTYILASSGTSFATPQVAGAAAVLRQQHPDWTPDQIKSILVNSATVATLDGQYPAGVNQAGAGRLDLAAAAANVVAVDPVSFSLGEFLPHGGILPGFQFGITNLSPDRLEVQLAVASSEPNLRLLLPETVTLPAGERVEVNARPALSGPVSPQAFEGSVRVLIPGGPALRIPLSGSFVSSGSRNILQVSEAGGSPFSSIEAALTQAAPGDVIEIQDSGTYPAPPTILTNRRGARLHGITLRAAAGQTPTLQAAAAAEAVIAINSLENVTIQGLILRGGRYGVMARNAGGVVRDCTFESDQQEAVFLDNSRFHLYGNLIRPAAGAGINVFGASSALIQKNQIGDTEGGRSEFGVFAGPTATVALFDNRVLETVGENGQGIRLAGKALVKNNLVLGSRGELGDGILLRGDSAEARLQDNLISSSRRYGISVFDGATAGLFRNRSLANSAAGLLVQDSTAEVSACTFVDNSEGIRANYALRLTLDSSLVARSSAGDGLFAGFSDPESRLEINHCTFADNDGFGVDWETGVLQISNSIFQGNLGGDFSQGPSSVRFSLLQDSAMAGQEGNYTGDPDFVDPSAVDYGLRSGSIAVDRGPEDDFSRHPGDLLAHQRVVDGNGDGRTVIDTGAVEFGSDSAAPLILPVLGQGPGEFQGVALANVFDPPRLPGTVASEPRVNRVRLRYYSESGNLMEEVERRIASQSQLSDLLTELFTSAARRGWIEILPSAPDLLSFTLTGSTGLRYLDGGQLERAVHRTLVLAEIREGGDDSTWITVINPGPQPQQIRVSWVLEGNSTTVERRLEARGVLAARVSELFPDALTGYLRVDGEEPIAAMELFGSSDVRGGLSGVAPSQGISRLVGAQLASTAAIESYLNLVNLGDDAVVTLTALDDAGIMVDQVTLTLSSQQQLNRSVSEIFDLPARDFVGWLAVGSLSQDLAGAIRFEDPDSRFLAALPLQEEGAREFLLSHVAQTPRIFTGLTLLNYGTRTALASLEVFAASGELRGLGFLTLGPGQKVARLLSQLVPEVTMQDGGFIRVRSTEPLGGFELFGDRNLNYLSAVPQQVVVK